MIKYIILLFALLVVAFTPAKAQHEIFDNLYVEGSVEATTYYKGSVDNDGSEGIAVTLMGNGVDVVRLPNENLVSVAGILEGVNGQRLAIVNATSHTIDILHQHPGVGSDSINTGGATIKLKPGLGLQLFYDFPFSEWRVIGGVGSSAVGDTDTMFVQDFESASDSDFCTMDGWALNKTGPLHGDVDLKVTHAASTTTYAVKQCNIPVNPKFRGKNVTIKLTAKSSADAGNLVLDAGCTTSNDLLNSESLDFSNLAGGNEAFASFDMPEDCTMLSYTVRALPQTGPPVSSLDDISGYLTKMQEVRSALVQEADSEIVAYGTGAYGSTANTTLLFGSVTSRGDGIKYISNAVNGDYFCAEVDGVYSATLRLASSQSVIYSRAFIAVVPDSTSNTSLYYFESRDNMNTANTTYKPMTISATKYLDKGQCFKFVSYGSGSPVTDILAVVSYQGKLKQVNVNPNQKVKIPTSEVRFEGASTRGSSATGIIKFDSVARLRGDAFILNPLGDPSVFGTHVQMNKSGWLNTRVVFSATAANYTYHVTKNQANTTTGPLQSEIITAQNGPSSGWYTSTAGSEFVQKGDIIRVFSGTNPSGFSGNFLHLTFQETEVQVAISNVTPKWASTDLNFKARGSAGQSLTNGVTLIPWNAYVDVNGQWDGDEFRVMDSGTYFIEGLVYVTAADSSGVDMYVNGVLRRRVSEVPTGTSSNHKFGSFESLDKDDVVSFRYVGGNATLQTTNSNLYHYLNITRVGKPNVESVDVTPFTNTPVLQTQSVDYTGSTVSSMTGTSKGSGIFSISGTTLTVLKRAAFNMTLTGTAVSTGATGSIYPSILVNGVAKARDRHQNGAGNSLMASAGINVDLTPGDTISWVAGEDSINTVNWTMTLVATAVPDTIVTEVDSFNSDTANFNFCSSATCTMANLNSQPIGTFITYSYTAASNTRAGCTTAPTQSVASMRSDGIQIFNRAYNAASTCASPAAFAVNIGKGMKGVTKNIYKSVGKVTSGSTDLIISNSGTTQSGMSIFSYDEVSGVLYFDAGRNYDAAVTAAAFLYSDINNQSNGYLTITASKNPALVGVNPAVPPIVYVRATQNSGQSIPNTTSTAVVWNTEVTDTHNAFNPATSIFTAPLDGYYRVTMGVLTASVAWTALHYMDIYYFKNGTALSDFRCRLGVATEYLNCNGSDTVYLKQGETLSSAIYIFRGAATTLHTSQDWNRITIELVGR